MGKLIELHLSNFKSWAGTHVLLFGDSFFTSVIGPNGSGKSNTMDAISFVLGIKSSHLRSTHLRDLIYRGRVLKHSKVDVTGDAHEDGEPNGVDEDEQVDASQTSSQRRDPQSAWVMAVYEDDAGEVQRWKRTITAAGQSEYRINSRPVSAKQYNDALEIENILIKARNFLVFQGDVEAVASQQPKDLTRLLEQISGSLEHAKDYDMLKAEKEKAEEDQNHKLQLRRGINGEIKAYQQQKEELDRFEQKRDDKEQAIVTHVLWKLYHFQHTIEVSTAEIQKHQEELSEFRRNVQKYEQRLDDAKREQAKVGRKVAKVQNAVKEKEREIGEKEQELLPIDEKLNISKSKLKESQKRVGEIASEKDAQQKNTDKFEKDLDKVQKAQKRWEDEWRVQQQQTGRALSKDDLDEYQRLRGEVYKQSGDVQMKVDNITRQVKTDEETVRSLMSTLDSARSSVEGLESEVNSLQERRTDVSHQVKSATKAVQAKQVSINNINSERTRSRQKSKELDEKLHQACLRLEEGQYQQRESAKDARQRETIAQMKRIFPGVKGMVHQLCRPKQKKYEVALPIVLGRQWDSVVVDSERTASECIQYLKDQRSGHIEFLPLDTIIHTQPNANLRGMHRGARLAIDTIEFDSSLERAMSSVCGSDMIADDWDIARELKWKRKVDVKIVTIDGRCITKADLISGGEGPGDRKRRFEDAEVENLRTLVERLKGDLDALPNDHKRQLEEEQLQNDLSGLQQELKYLQEELAALDRNIESKTKELEFARRQLAETLPLYEEQRKGLETLQQQLTQCTARVSQTEDKIFRDFCRRLDFANIREYEHQQGSMQQEAKVKKQEFSTQISRLENQLTYERQRLKYTRDRITTIEGASKRDHDLIAQLERQKEQLSNELDELVAEIEQLQMQLDALKQESEEKGSAVAEARREVEKRSKSVNKTLQAVAAWDADVETAAAGRYMELRRCKVENIALPLEDGSRTLDSLPLEDAIPEEYEEDTAMDIDGEEGTRISRIKDYGINPAYDGLEESLREDDGDDVEARLQETIASIQSELDKMAPNMRSTERLEATSEKLKATDRDFGDARNSARKATKEFEAVQKKRMDLFNKAFAHIRDQIEPVYRDLTKSVSWPLGGKAYLDVEDEDEPYLSGVKYHATPPGKRFRDMEHLSGGEKTMAALALLFAIHTYAPSPFFVLDEVDAALDVANTTRLANYVKEHAGPGMQFVVISLKTGLFQNSETLVGVMRDQTLNSSKALMLDVSLMARLLTDARTLTRVAVEEVSSGVNTTPSRRRNPLPAVSRHSIAKTDDMMRGSLLTAVSTMSRNYIPAVRLAP